MKRGVSLVVALTLLGACNADGGQPAATGSPPPASPPAPHDALDRLDARTPVPLLPVMANHQKANMRDHLAAVQEIVAAVATDDFSAVERATARIGFTESMGQMCSHMGSGAPGFTEQALDFHRNADRIATAARDRDRSRVLTELGATLQRCTSCHQTWKQQIVDDATWERITATSAPTGDSHTPH